MLYHADVQMPRHIRGMVPKGVKTMRYSQHALNERNDKFGYVQLPTSLNFAKATLVEVQVFGNVLDKVVIRQSHDEKTDLVLVCVPFYKGEVLDKKQWFVKTVWLNTKDDNHATLDKNRFAKRKFG